MRSEERTKALENSELRTIKGGDRVYFADWPDLDPETPTEIWFAVFRGWDSDPDCLDLYAELEFRDGSRSLVEINAGFSTPFRAAACAHGVLLDEIKLLDGKWLADISKPEKTNDDNSLALCEIVQITAELAMKAAAGGLMAPSANIFKGWVKPETRKVAHHG